MFDIGWGELVVIGIVALIAIGPKELPGVLRTFGQTMAKIRRMAAEFQGQFMDAMREAEFESVRKELADLNEKATASIAAASRGASIMAPIRVPRCGMATSCSLPRTLAHRRAGQGSDFVPGIFDGRLCVPC